MEDLRALEASGRNKDGIVALDFSTDGSWLRASTANHAAQHWDVSGGVELDEGALVLRDETWQTWTSAVGWNESMYGKTGDEVRELGTWVWRCGDLGWRCEGWGWRCEDRS